MQPQPLSARSSFEQELNETSHPSQRMKRALRAVGGGYRDNLWRTRFYGWRMGVLLGTCTSTFVLACNIAMIIVGSKTRSGYDRDGVATLLEGDEDTVSWWNTICHVFINVLSTLLLSASNYTMQVLNSPTRQEMDRAHSRGKWLDVGLISIHNLKVMSRKRACLCLGLAVSSLPLHLLWVILWRLLVMLTDSCSYNAAIFKIITMTEYSVTVLTSDYDSLPNIQANVNIHRLDNSQWRKIYNSPNITRYSDLYLLVDGVSNETQRTQGAKGIPDFLLTYFPANLSISEVTDLTKAGWTTYTPWYKENPKTKHALPGQIHIKEGYATSIQRQSRVQISLSFMALVAFFNFVKLALMLSVLLMDTLEYIVTLGDAVSSYLHHPEELTKGRSTLELDQMLDSFDARSKVDYHNSVWQPRRRRYCSSIGYDKAWSAIIA
jgi:hypothetical protein